MLDNSLKQALRNSILTILPETLSGKIFGVWRKIYWWKRNQIDPGKNRRTIDMLLESEKPIKLELGSWKREGMDDWTFSDLSGGGDLELDLSKPIPFPDSSVSMIYSSHLIEHFAYPSPMQDLLSECYRILIPGGVFSVAVPDARIYIEAYVNDKQLSEEEFLNHDVGLKFKNKIDYVNFVAYQGEEHKHMFDQNNLISVIEDSGFANARIREYDPKIDLARRQLNSIYAIAQK